MRLVAGLAVIGNVARVESVYPDGVRRAFLGGAALHVALAAARAGLAAAPVSVIGDDLAWITDDPRLAAVDLSAMKVASGPSCAFRLTYDVDGELVGVDSAYGVAAHLTDHALDHVGRHSAYHVSCRRPLDAARMLAALGRWRLEFSVDFFASSAAEMIAAVAPALRHACLLFANAAEYRTLSAALSVDGLPAVLVTDGPRPARLWRHGTEVASAVPPITKAVEVTGAGDTLAGAFLASHKTGIGDEAALRRAVAAASAHTFRPDLPIDPHGRSDRRDRRCSM